MNPPERLQPADVDAIASRVVELLREETSPRATPALVDAATVARALGVSRATVYEHARRLGALRLGDGPRGRLRFVLEEAVEAWTAREGSRGSRDAEVPPATEVPRRRRRRSTPASVQLLPVRGRDR
jgi:hypothetical protein